MCRLVSFCQGMVEAISNPEVLADTISTTTSLPIASISQPRKLCVFVVLCTAQFLDAFNSSALFSAIPSISGNIEMDASETAWLLSAYSLTFASFLLVSGRISDVYGPKFVFIAGITTLGAMFIGAGFVRNKIAFFIIRAISGIGASLTTPPAVSMIVQIFPMQNEQSRAIAIFGGTGAIAGILGLFIGAVLVQYTSWTWIFWFMGIIAILNTITAIFIIPGQPRPQPHHDASFDFIGISTLTASLILFIFAITSGTISGWFSARVLVPLFTSPLIFAGFLYWEAKIPERQASLPPKIWFYPNFSVLLGIALLPYLWWDAVFLQYTALWQEIYHWSAISTALHFLPLGIISAIVPSLASSLPNYVNTKWVLLTHLFLVLIGTILFPFADTETIYWPLIFTGFIMGTFGNMMVFCSTNIGILSTAPSEIAGTIGAIFNAALQLGSAVGIAALTSIQTSIDAGTGDSTHFKGRAAGFWFLFVVVALELFAVLFFFRSAYDGKNEVKSSDIDQVEVW